jgi:hypothetical protein
VPSTLRKGDKCEDARRLQKLLNLHLSATEGYDRLEADGDFGPLTDARVREFQTLNGLTPDGVVGILTREKLLETRLATTTATLAPRDYPISRRAAVATARTGARGFAFTPGARVAVAPVGAPVGDPAPPNTVTRTIQVQGGQQFAVNPWLLSPMVITGQVNWLVKNNGRPDFQLTVGAQVALNDVQGPSGLWTGQGFAQMGLSGLSSLFKSKGFDLANPFVVAMLQRSEQPAPFSFGLGIGNQMNLHLRKDQSLTLFLNGQGVTTVTLSNGRGSAPGLQILGGVTFTFKWPGEKP